MDGGDNVSASHEVAQRLVSGARTCRPETPMTNNSGAFLPSGIFFAYLKQSQHQRRTKQIEDVLNKQTTCLP
jgi:hypothetical protein